MIWLKTYVFSTFNKKEDFSRLKIFRERFFFVTGSRWPPDSNFTMRKRTSIQYSLILDKNLLLAFLVQQSFWRSMWCILQYNLFSSNSDHCQYSKAIQNGWASHSTLPFVTWKMHNKHFWPKITIMTLFSLHLWIFNIYLLCIKQN